MTFDERRMLFDKQQRVIKMIKAMVLMITIARKSTKVERYVGIPKPETQRKLVLPKGDGTSISSSDSTPSIESRSHLKIPSKNVP